MIPRYPATCRPTILCRTRISRPTIRRRTIPRRLRPIRVCLAPLIWPERRASARIQFIKSSGVRYAFHLAVAAWRANPHHHFAGAFLALMCLPFPASAFGLEAGLTAGAIKQ
jgi:hypothetical protein